MEPQSDAVRLTRRDIEEMMRRRRNLGATISVLGALGLFALVYLFVPADNRGGEPIAAARQTLSH